MSSSEFSFFLHTPNCEKLISKFNQEIEMIFLGHKHSKSLKVKSRVLNKFFINEVEYFYDIL